MDIFLHLYLLHEVVTGERLVSIQESEVGDGREGPVSGWYFLDQIIEKSSSLANKRRFHQGHNDGIEECNFVEDGKEL